MEIYAYDSINEDNLAGRIKITATLDDLEHNYFVYNFVKDFIIEEEIKEEEIELISFDVNYKYQEVEINIHTKDWNYWKEAKQTSDFSQFMNFVIHNL